MRRPSVNNGEEGRPWREGVRMGPPKITKTPSTLVIKAMGL